MMTMIKVGSDDPDAYMTKTFKHVKRVSIGKCPKCGVEKYRCTGYLIPGDKSTYVDITSSCNCDIENERKIADMRASAKVNKNIRNEVFMSSGFRLSEKEMISKKFAGNLVEKYNKGMLWASRFNSDTRRGIIIAGSTGTGKSMTAVHIINRIMERGFVGKFTTAANIYDIYRQSFTDPIASDEFAKMKTCDVLCIDDLGAEYTTEAATYQIVNLLEERMSWSRPTVITTNLTDQELLQRYGQRFVSRIHENFFKLVYTGEDMRMKKSR